MAFFKNAVLVCVTAVVVYVLPGLLTKKLPIITAGTVEPGFEAVANLFRNNFENGVEDRTDGGSAYSVYYKGSKVVDLWGGYADSQPRRAWKEDTMAVVFSTTKGIAAICMAMLVDRGLLDYDKTVASYWPEFAQNGKENVTVRMLFNHRAGLSYTSQPISYELMRDQDALGKVLAQSAPAWEPDTAHGYHALTFGLYLSQLLRRVDPKHRTLGQFLQEEIAEPFDVDFHIGLPLEQSYRTARLTGDFGGNVILGILKGFGSPLNRAVLLAILTGKSDFDKIAEKSSGMLETENYINPEVLAIEQPSSQGVGTARAVAKVYGILANGGQDSAGQRLLSDDVIKRFIIEAKRDDDSKDRTIGVPMINSLGFAITEHEGSLQFGHPGAGGMQGLADPQRKLGISYISSYYSPFGLGDDPRFTTLQSATYECVKKLEGK